MRDSRRTRIAPAAPTGPPDDMVDSKHWLASESLGETLRFCRDQLYQDYARFDGQALRRQRVHYLTTIAVAVLGLVAVSAGVYQLCPACPLLDLAAMLRKWCPACPALPAVTSAGLELLSMLLAAAVVAGAVYLSLHQTWLLYRHKAERLRQLKFAYLISPALWFGTTEERQQLRRWFDGELREIRRLQRSSLERWLQKDEPPTVPSVPAHARWSSSLGELRDYYLETRLALQQHYFESRSAPDALLYRITYGLTPILFAVTAVVVFSHAGIGDLLGLPEAEWKRIATILLVVGVALPALGTGIRSFRAATEFDRNALRSRATKSAMDTAAAWLEKDHAPPALFQHLASCEYVLEADHREWLRLMIEAEWFG